MMVYLILAYYKDHWSKALDREDAHVVGVVYDAPDGLSQEEIFRLAIERGHIHPDEFGDNSPIDPDAVWAVPCPEYFTRIDLGTIPVRQLLGDES